MILIDNQLYIIWIKQTCQYYRTILTTITCLKMLQ